MGLVPCGALAASTVVYNGQKQGLTSETPGPSMALPLVSLCFLVCVITLLSSHSDGEV